MNENTSHGRWCVRFGGEWGEKVVGVGERGGLERCWWREQMVSAGRVGPSQPPPLSEHLGPLQEAGLGSGESTDPILDSEPGRVRSRGSSIKHMRPGLRSGPKPPSPNPRSQILPLSQPAMSNPMEINTAPDTQWAFHNYL